MAESGININGVVTRDLQDDLLLKRGHSSESEEDNASKVQRIDNVANNTLTSKRNIPLFLVISHKEKGKNLSKVSPFLINKSLVGVGGQPAAVRKLRSGDILVEAASATQATRYLNMKSFFDQVPVNVEPHGSLNSSKGIVFCRELIDCSAEEICEELGESLVTGVVRIVRRENGREVPTPGLILTFDSPSPPEKIRAGYLSIPVRPYFRNPQRCYRCQKFGHSSKSCTNAETCGRCGQEGHNDSECGNDELCCNCGGIHHAKSRDCRKYLEEKEILKIATVEKLSFLDARKEYRRRQVSTPKQSVTYSQAVAAPSQQTQCSSCSKLESMVKALMEQVTILTKQLSATSDIPHRAQTQKQSSPTASISKQPSNKVSAVKKQQMPTNVGTIPKVRPTAPSLTPEERKKLAIDLRNKIASQKEARSKGHAKSPTTPNASQSSSLHEDMVVDALDSQTEFQTVSGKFQMGRKPKKPITLD